MKFNSQICTTKEQSERLLALGLKKETADCIWYEVRTLSKDNPIQWHLLPEHIDKYDEKHIPAWSLHRLREEKGIMIGITIWLQSDGSWRYRYKIQTKEDDIRTWIDYSTYELALEDALKYALEYLI